MLGDRRPSGRIKMVTRKKISQVSSFVVLVCVSVFSTNLAHAEDAAPTATDRPTLDSPTPNTTDESSIRLHVRIDGELVPLSSEFVDAYTDDLPTASRAEAGQPNADLISFDQWIRCFTLNMFDDSYALYTHYSNGSFHDIRLKCGEGGES